LSRSEDQICRMTGFLHEAPGAPCGVCGHTNMVHTIGGGHQRVTNDECQLCRLEFLNGRLEDLVEQYTATINRSPEGQLGKTREPH
jgi:hypothetical protein